EKALDLGGLRKAAGDGLAVDTPMGEREARREAGRARGDPFAHEVGHASDLFCGGGPLIRVVTHDIEAQRAVAHVDREVEERASTADGGEVFGKRLELPSAAR